MSAASLKVTSKARPGSRLAVEVAIPAERSQASYEAAISQLSRSVNLPGFRKGKVPRSVLVQQLGWIAHSRHRTREPRGRHLAGHHQTGND